MKNFNVLWTFFWYQQRCNFDLRQQSFVSSISYFYNKYYIHHSVFIATAIDSNEYISKIQEMKGYFIVFSVHHLIQMTIEEKKNMCECYMCPYCILLFDGITHFILFAKKEKMNVSCLNDYSNITQVKLTSHHLRIAFWIIHLYLCVFVEVMQHWICKRSYAVQTPQNIIQIFFFLVFFWKMSVINFNGIYLTR